jgi:hypothetical protein
VKVETKCDEKEIVKMTPKQLLDIAIRSILLTEESKQKQHELIMQMIESYEAMKEV